MNKAVLYYVSDGVAIITLNRPDRYNAVNQDLVDGISESLYKAKDDESVRAIVMTGAGRANCAGVIKVLFYMLLLI